jgi:hypothetical protein
VSLVEGGALEDYSGLKAVVEETLSYSTSQHILIFKNMSVNDNKYSANECWLQIYNSGNN